jgi:hypothetical protein
MDTPVFSMGVVSPRRRQRVQRPPNIYNPKWPQMIPKFSLSQKLWLLKKPADFHMEYTLATAGYSYRAVMTYLNDQMHIQMQPGFLSFTHPTPEARKALLTECMSYAKKNHRMRQKFSEILRRWLGKRLRASNEDDLMTGEPPKVPITIVAWPERRRYIFEATTIQRDMTSRLLQHDFLFAKFTKPRNPYTNLELTPGQFFHTMKQLRAAGHTNWMLEGLYSCNYDMERFKEQFGEALKLQIINRQFKNITDETIEIIHEFIEDYHLENRAHFNASLYRWALSNAQDTSRIKLWIKKCREYYIALATITDPLTLGAALQEIKRFTRRLCTPPTDLTARKEAAFKNKLLTERGHRVDLREEISALVDNILQRWEVNDEHDDAVEISSRRFVFEFNLPQEATVSPHMSNTDFAEYVAYAAEAAAEAAERAAGAAAEASDISGEDREASELTGEDREEPEISGNDEFTA